jgi:hypothetical protein
MAPLFQTSFDPDLMQVNFFPEKVWVAFNLLHFCPAFGAAAKAIVVMLVVATQSKSIVTIKDLFLTPKGY